MYSQRDSGLNQVDCPWISCVNYSQFERYTDSIFETLIGLIMLKLRTLLLMLLLGFTAQVAASVTAYDTINRTPGALPYEGSGWWVGAYPELQSTVSNVAVAFTPSVSGVLTNIEAAVSVLDDQLYPGSGLSWSIAGYDGVSSDVDNVLWSADYEQALGDRSELELTDFAVSGGVYLEEGTEYWLVLNAVIDNQVLLLWSASNTGAVADFRVDVLNSDGSSFINYFADQQTFAFALQVAPVPLPAAFWLFASGLAGLAINRSNRRR